MEAPRSVGGRIQRKALADCTNTVSRSSQQPSSSVKYANPSLTSSLKRLVDQTTLKEKKKPPNDVNTSEAAPVSASRSLSTKARPVTRRVSADLGSPASAPSRPQTSRSDLGVSDKEFSEPRSVYTVRRKASGQKRSKDASSSSAAARLRLDLASTSGKKTDQTKESKTKPLKKAPKKRQRTLKQENEKSVHAASQDYIEQQKAYFAEIDAFELPVEEASISDLDK